MVIYLVSLGLQSVTRLFRQRMAEAVVPGVGQKGKDAQRPVSLKQIEDTGSQMCRSNSCSHDFAIHFSRFNPGKTICLV